jgi:hypothetical protein
MKYNITGFNGQGASTQEIAMFTVNFDNINWNMSALVLPTLLCSSDLIFGINWCEYFDPIVNWRNKTIKLDSSRIQPQQPRTTDMILASFHVLQNSTTTSNMKMHIRGVVPKPQPITHPSPQYGSDASHMSKKHQTIEPTRNNTAVPESTTSPSVSHLATDSFSKIKYIQPHQMKQLLSNPENRIMCSIVLLPTPGPTDCRALEWN